MTVTYLNIPHIPSQSAVPNAPQAPGLRAVLKTWLARRVRRQMLRKELLPQPDSVLADAGLTRAEATAEAAKPFWTA